jgi:hypothetical protein
VQVTGRQVSEILGSTTKAASIQKVILQTATEIERSYNAVSFPVPIALAFTWVRSPRLSDIERTPRSKLPNAFADRAATFAWRMGHRLSPRHKTVVGTLQFIVLSSVNR